MPNNFYGLRTWIPADAPRTFERLGGLAINYVKSVRVTATSSATCYLWPVSLSGNKWHNIPAGNRFASWQNCELRVMNEGRTSYGRQTKRQLLLSHSPFWRHYIITSLPLPLSLSPSLNRLLYQMPRTWPPHGPIFSLLCSLFMATLREGGSWNGVQMRSDQNLLCCPQPRPSAAFISKFMSLSWESIWFLYPLRT